MSCSEWQQSYFYSLRTVSQKYLFVLVLGPDGCDQAMDGRGTVALCALAGALFLVFRSQFCVSVGLRLVYSHIYSEEKIVFACRMSPVELLTSGTFLGHCGKTLQTLCREPFR